MTTERKIVDDRVNDYVDFGDILDGKTPDQIIEAAADFKKTYEGRDIYFDIQSYGYDGGKELVLRERRLETDKELALRIKAEEKVKAKVKEEKVAKEAKELKEYERLKKKFGGK
jgi:hypothetical protein